MSIVFLHSMEHPGILAFLNKELRFSQPALPTPSRFIISSQLSCFSRFLKGKSNRSLARQYMSVGDVNSHYITIGVNIYVLQVYVTNVNTNCAENTFVTRLNCCFIILLFLQWPE